MRRYLELRATSRAHTPPRPPRTPGPGLLHRAHRRLYGPDQYTATVRALHLRLRQP